MKRLITIATAMLLISTASTQAQSVKVDEAGVTKKLEKLVTESQDAKKNTKAALWIDLGKTYIDAAIAPTTGLYKGMEQAAVYLMYGKVDETKETVGGTEYAKLTYPYADLYFTDGRLVLWNVKKNVVEDALKKANDAYLKAYSLDQSTKVTDVVKDGLRKVSDGYKQDAENFFVGQQFEPAAGAFAEASRILAQQPVNEIDTAAIFNAGFLYTVANSFEKGEKYLKEAEALGYENEGDLYYYLFHTYYGRKDLVNSKEILLKGISKYPKNTKIVESIVNLYAETGDDPNNIIPYVMQAIDADPKNPELYAGLGRIYDKMGNSPKSLESFGKALELAPEDFAINFNIGLMIIKSGDNFAAIVRDKPTTSQADFNKDIKDLNAIYATALAPLEKAHSLNPTETAVVELLKNVYFRLRDESPEMMTNYNKYNDLYKSM